MNPTMQNVGRGKWEPCPKNPGGDERPRLKQKGSDPLCCLCVSDFILSICIDIS